MARIRGPHRILAEAAQRQAPEGRPKVHTVERIDERIHGAVEPAQPRQAIGHIAADVALRQKRCDQVVDEKGQPAHDETADDDAERLGGLALALHRRDALRAAVGRRRRCGRCAMLRHMSVATLVDGEPLLLLPLAEMLGRRRRQQDRRGGRRGRWLFVGDVQHNGMPKLILVKMLLCLMVMVLMLVVVLLGAIYAARRFGSGDQLVVATVA